MNNLIVYAFFIIFTFLHIWVFWIVYKRLGSENNFFAVFSRGFVAGVVGSYFSSIILSFIFRETYFFFVYVYLSALVFAIGVFFTLLFWWIINKTGLKAGLFKRTLFGLLIGATVGLTLSFSFDNKNAVFNQQIIWTLFFAIIASASGIMAGKKEIND